MTTYLFLHNGSNRVLFYKFNLTKQIRFIGVKGSDFQGDSALDDISAYQGYCGEYTYIVNIICQRNNFLIL